MIDGNGMKMDKLKLKKNPKCKACEGKYEFLDKKSNNFQKLCSSFQTRAILDLNETYKKLIKNSDFLIEYKGKDSMIINYLPKNVGIILFTNRLIVKTSKEKEARILANKIIA